MKLNFLLLGLSSALLASVLHAGAHGQPGASLPPATAMPDALAVQCSTVQAAPPAARCEGPQTGSTVSITSPAGQLQRWVMEGGSFAYGITLFGPHDEPLRYWPPANNGTQEVAWVTPTAGRYRLHAQLQDFSQAPAPVWTLQFSGATDAKASCAAPPAQTPLLSPALRQLQADLAQAGAGQAATRLAAFWQGIASQGAPLLEATAHPQETLVTFLWRAPPDSATTRHCISVDWAVRSETGVDLQPLPGTDIWYASLVLPRGLKVSYQLVVDPPSWSGAGPRPPSRQERVQARALAAQRDPLNPQRWHAGAPALDPASEAARFAQKSVLHISESGALANIAQDLPATALTEGTLHHLRFDSPLMGNRRSVSLYLPQGQRAPGSLPLLVLFDREPYLARTRIDAQLDQWIKAGHIAPIALLLVANPTRAARAQELPPNDPAFGRMLTTELLPWVRQHYPQITQQADQVVVAGSSYGGLAAGSLGWSYPEVFGNVLSLSGSYWWSPPSSESPHRWAEQDWLMQQIARSPTQPLRWFLSYGLLERGVQGTGGILDNNRHLRNVLQAKGYTVHSHEYGGGHDYYVWGDEILQGLQTLLPVPRRP